MEKNTKPINITTMKKKIIRIGRYRLRSISAHYFTCFQKTYGNPYFAMIVTVNQGYPSEQTFVVPMQHGCPHYQYVTAAVLSHFQINDPDGRKRVYPCEYGIRIYEFETPTSYRQIVKIK